MATQPTASRNWSIDSGMTPACCVDTRPARRAQLPSQRRRGVGLALLASAGLLWLAPKCPLCFLAYAALLGAGLSAFAQGIGALALGMVAVCTLAVWAARRRLAR